MQTIMHNQASRGIGPAALPRTLRILSYNVQVGVDTRKYRDYLTKSWKHVFPHRNRLHNLNMIAEILRQYDMVALQEVDAGSLRSGFVDITEYLANRAGFPHWYHQVNRNIGMLARHSNGFLTRIRPTQVTNHRLPAAPGRGAMLLEFGEGDQSLSVCTLHLALSRRARSRQLDFIRDMLGGCKNLVVMGDLNTGCESDELRRFIEMMGLMQSAHGQATFPSWRPSRKIDHILVSPGLQITKAQVLDYPLSDHLPIGVEIALPDTTVRAA